MRLTSPEEVASRLGSLMEGFEAPWCVAGGWALDLFLGRATRDHGDVELAVFRQDQSLIHSQFPGWTLTVSINGRREPWKPTNRLELPVHEIHAYSPDEPPEGIELLLNERDPENWVFRRDPGITSPFELAILESEFGVPVLSPEIVLLFKAKAPRAKDEQDVRVAHPAMSESSRRWLHSAIQTGNPDHPWLALLEASDSTGRA